MPARIRRLARRARDRGASAVEYGLLVAAIAAAIVGVVFGLGGFVRQAFQHTCDTIAASPAGGGKTCAPAGQVPPPP
jgi:pilus assembly protein Flp/PilA